jgi:MFS family permease
MRFLAALGMGGLMPNAISLMTEYSPKKNRAVIVAAMYCGYSAGGVLASLVGMFSRARDKLESAVSDRSRAALCAPVFFQPVPRISVILRFEEEDESVG